MISEVNMVAVSEGAWDHLLLRKTECNDGVLFSFEEVCGALAQLGERLLCTQEVSGSIPKKFHLSFSSKLVH